MRITAIQSTDLFSGSARQPHQVVRVRMTGPAAGPLRVSVDGPAVRTPEPVVVPGLADGEERVVEVGVAVAVPAAEGAVRRVTAVGESTGERAALDGEIEVAATGWTMWMVSHFHYDPVWWNTQAGFTETWYDLPAAEGLRPPVVKTAFDLVRAHLDAARHDPDYKFVLAELDYLKPHWDAYPEDRADLRRLLREGRVELVGGNYNEANTNLTHPESTIRNAVYGVGYQRDVVGGEPRSAWMLDVFGHDPAYPGLMADAGLESSAWARGPFHMWGPNRHAGDNRRMQFPSEFEWISPTGRGLLTSYMANHYGAGWDIEDRAGDLDEAMAEAYRQFGELKPVAATRNVLLPVGADHVVPSRWCTEIHRAWAKRYVWPRFRTAVPRDFFAAVRAETAERGAAFSPQTRDMNPVYTGCDVSYIDTKQAQRAAEVAVLDAERLATLAALLDDAARYPHEALDKAWRLLAFGAHHDAITGSESDQVYLDLLGGWREAYELGAAARAAAIAHIAAHADTSGPGRPVLAVNTLSWARDGITTVSLAYPPGATPGVEVRDDAGAAVPAVADGMWRHPDGTIGFVTLTFLARDVPSLGFRTYWVADAADAPAGWHAAEGVAAENGAFRVAANPERGGALTRITDLRTGRELLRPGGLGALPVLQEEHATHPVWGEGPWHLLPKGPGRAPSAARVRAETCPIGARLVAESELAGLRVTQEVLLWHGVDRVDFRTHVDGSIGQDHLLRVRFDAGLPGAKPVAEVGFAAIGRSFGFPSADAGPHLWTLETPVHTWAGLSAPVRIALPGGRHHAIGVAEVVAPDGGTGRHAGAVRALVAGLAAQGVTATCTSPAGPRYGALDVDSNLPDVRIVLGADNAVAAEVLAAAGPAFAAQLARHGRVLVPPARTVAATWVPGADLRGPRDLPVLIVAGADLDAAIGAITGDLADAVIEVPYGDTMEPAGDYSIGLLNQGTPSFVAEADGTMYLSLMRACSAWPCGVWLDGERRTAPDGSSFAWQHWTHTFAYSLIAGPGDWRRAGFARAGAEYNHAVLAAATAPGEGGLPSATALASVEPPDVLLTALKPRGNPMASGLSAGTGTPAEAAATGLTLRLYESAGRPATAHVRLFTGLADARLTDLLERAAGHGGEERHRARVTADAAVAVDLAAADVVTLAVRSLDAAAAGPAGPRRRSAGDSAPPAEPAQPVFARYWRHNNGPAPIGYLPVAVHVSPTSVLLPGPGDTARLRLTVACSAAPAAGRIELRVPPGLAVDTPPAAYDLAAGEHAELGVTVRADDAAPGTYFLAAAIRDALGQTIEDVAAVTVGAAVTATAGAGAGAGTGEPLEITLEPNGLILPPGGRGELVLRLRGRAHSEIRGEARLLSPYGTWDTGLHLAAWARGFTVAPGAAAELRYLVEVPLTARPGAHWWALVKVAYFGHLHYTRAVPIEVTGA
jgi:alpha-mannosidase